MLKITKTPKCLVGGAFIRSESGRVYPMTGRKGEFLCHIPLCSRKDLRNAVETAAKAAPPWAGRSGYNRSLILYRIAEMLESRAEELAAWTSESEVQASIARVLHYAGWADKFEQVLGTVNPVASPHFSFTITEPMGIVAVLGPERPSLLGLLSMILPAVVSGNSVIGLASRSEPYPALLLGEILAVSDLPGGVINLLTGDRDELLPAFAEHQHIRAIHAVANKLEASLLQERAAETVKRIRVDSPDTNWFSSSHDSLYAIRDFTESKTIWHPIGI